MQIKFSHCYSKLLSDSGSPVLTAKLLNVIEIELDETPKVFLDYDTDNGIYELPKKGTFLMLIFQKPNGNHLFTTLRRFTPEKFNYYHAAIGQVFQVVLSTEAKAEIAARNEDHGTSHNTGSPKLLGELIEIRELIKEESYNAAINNLTREIEQLRASA